MCQNAYLSETLCTCYFGVDRVTKNFGHPGCRQIFFFFFFGKSGVNFEKVVRIGLSDFLKKNHILCLHICLSVCLSAGFGDEAREVGG